MNEMITDVAIIGGGIAGIVCALEIMDNDLKTGNDTKILIIDRDKPENFGGLAKLSFGGIWAVDTPEQKKARVKDSVELALKDWMSFGEFDSFAGDTASEAQEKQRWAKAWATEFVQHCKTDVYDWLKARGIKFLALPLWVERGLHGGGNVQAKGGGNSVPRWHIIWGTGSVLMEKLIEALEAHPKRGNVNLVFEHFAKRLVKQGDRVTGCQGVCAGDDFFVEAKATVVAAGGINGSMEMVRKHWHKDWSQPPKTLLNGSHKHADGTLHHATEQVGGNITFLENMWNYAAGVRHWRPKKPNHGLSLVPSKSALWLNALGKRIMPPLVTGFDTRDLITQICKQPEGYSWQLLNYKIALKEFAISGAEFNDAFREQSYLQVAKQMAFGSKKLVNEAVEHCADIVSAKSLEALVEKMNALPAVNGETSQVLLENVQHAVSSYDAAIDAGEPFTDEQLKFIKKAREWQPDKLRTCAFQKIADKKAGPFIAIREFVVSRKSLGGIQTNMDAQVLTPEGGEIAGLYAVGEAAGFGGGGMNGLRGLEGTFLAGCVFSARKAAQAITRQ